jgi:hypothetical protein
MYIPGVSIIHGIMRNARTPLSMLAIIMDKWGIVLAYLLGLTFVHFYMSCKFCLVNEISTVLGQTRVSLIA